MKPRVTSWLRPLAWLATAAATATAWSGTAMKSTEPALPEGVAVARDVKYREVDGRPLALDVYRPTEPTSTPRPALVAIHGGSWTGGSRRDYGAQLARLATRGLVVVAIDYRLARPDAPSWDGALDDAASAVAWLRENAKRFTIDPDRIATIGTSAGGTLAAHLAVGPPLRNGRPSEPRVAASICLSTPYDLTALVESRGLPHEPALDFVGGQAPMFVQRLADASPIHHVTNGSRPILLIHGTEDLWVPIEQARRMRDRLQGVGVPHRLIEVEGSRHGFELQVGGPNPRDLSPEVIAFLQAAWGNRFTTGTFGAVLR